MKRDVLSFIPNGDGILFIGRASGFVYLHLSIVLLEGRRIDGAKWVQKVDWMGPLDPWKCLNYVVVL